MNIFNSSIQGDIQKVESNLKKGVDINSYNKDGCTPLHLATAFSHLDLIRYLLANGADINFHTENNYTPIEIACNENKIESAKLLISSGCEIKNAYCCACHYSASWGYYDILKLLLDNGANANGRDFWGRTPAHWAAQEGHLDIIKLLDEYNADFNIMDEEEQTPIYIAAGENHLDIVKYLISRNICVDYEKDTTPFMIACAFNRFEVAIELLKAGANINHKDSDGRTALFYAKTGNKRKLEKLLLANGASTDVTDNTGISITDLDNEAIRKKLYNELW